MNMHRRNLAALSMLASALFSSPATAASVIDFEDFDIGHVFSYGSSSELGTPYPFLTILGVVVANPFGDGKVVQLAPILTAVPHSFTHLSAYRIDRTHYYTPIVESFDIFSPTGGKVSNGFVHSFATPGEWGSYSYGFVGGVGGYIRVNSVEAYIDNIVYQDVISLVPEPQTWTMMITGFGLVGAGLRRRRSPHGAPMQLT